MRLSTYHKQLGNSVKLGYEPLFDNPDLCYASKVFTFSSMPEYMPECETHIGGSGYDLSAKIDIPDYDQIMPDYSLYSCEYALGRFTRGCPNNCPWCVVPKMDGNIIHHVADLKDFWGGQKVVRLLDDNIMADSDEFCRDCEQLSKAGVYVIFDALDARLVTNETAKALAKVKTAKSIHFAWDGHSQDEAVPRAISILNRNGIKPYRLMFYVLVGFNTPEWYDIERIYTLKDLGVNPFVMPFDKTDAYQKRLARWCNNKFIFKKVPDFSDYRG